MTAIRDIMTNRVAAIRPETTLAQAVEFLVEHHVGGAPVVDDGALVGVVSESALIDIVFDADVWDAPVSRYMTREVQVVKPDDPLSRAAQLFALHSFRWLPVVKDGKLVGIISRRDLMHHALRSKELLVEPLEELIPALTQIS
jgi:CBS domain-containing protein